MGMGGFEDVDGDVTYFVMLLKGGGGTYFLHQFEVGGGG